MNKIEKLISEFDHLTFHFMNDMPEGLKGLICDKNIYIKDDMPNDLTYSTLAEEIGHYETALGDFIDQNNLINRKLELQGRRWSYKKLVPNDQLKKFIKDKEEVYAHDIAEEFEVPAEIVKNVVEMYKVEGKL